MRGTQERKKKKTKGGAEKRQQRPGDNGRKFNRFPAGYPIPPAPSALIKRYRHTCACGGTFVADSQEAFCWHCGSNRLIVTDVLESS